jgi:voltage-gated potassium channel
MRTLGKRLLTGFLALLAVVFVGAAGYYAIGDGKWAFWDCVYMTIITITTVGYGETLEGMDKVEYARGWTIVLLVFGTGSIVFFASMITAFIVEGDLKEALFAQKLKKRIKRMQQHVVVCGAGSTGRAVIEEMLKTNVPVIAVDILEHEVKEIADKYPTAEFGYLVGDATDDDILAQMNLAAARGLIAALASDKDNLYLAVSARQTNPNLRIVARAAELAHVDKMKRAGADAVVSPNFIGGMRLVSEMVRPAVVGFLDTMLRDKRGAYRIEEVTLKDGKLGGTLREARIHERFGMNVLAMKSEAKEYTYNPGPDEKLPPGVTLVVLGSAEQVASLRKEIA